MLILYLCLLGLAFGSFVNALVWRVRVSKSLGGRSQCPYCKHQLSAFDLVPVLSWLILRGKCRYCKKPISWQYPLVELTMAFVFVASYLFWPTSLEGAGDWLLFATWLFSSVGLLALLVYDFRWMLLPSRILYPTLAITAAGQLLHMFLFEEDIVRHLVNLSLSVAVASGVFLFIYIISSGKWIGFGDVRLGLVTGTLLASPALSFLMLFLASLLGTFFALPQVLKQKRSLKTKIPYGPFLITATWLSLLFGQKIIDWYLRTATV